ncbi:hypothetical protein K443DRAFT_282042 [Laccaria amethystina LaAM-08-1]|uniref:Unplaced genomic scaffold K443scaffold_183, whole genome shotgun sequence n=1 Tax=Laccaria amethystina LaAM-08-1 TaxID=1095629 RepID=A0A0C9WVM1_9AGAR|nr:hypothetical protein K443DRAFT_282042 [Laccaria amethystina LaAM-08-1]
MLRNNTSTQLSSLTEWSVQHIQHIFESTSDEAALRAVENTFSDDLIATVNGARINQQGIKHHVLALRQSPSRGGLKVYWQHTVEASRDPTTNRDGSFGGVYIIRGIQKVLPGNAYPTEFERHKTVTASIESQSPDSAIDSRKIVNLVFVASDVRVVRQSAL